VTSVAPAGGSATGRSGEVELWTARLDLAALENRLSGSLLSEEELERARRLRFESDRVHFTASRLWLRLVLAHGLGVGTAEIRLQTRSDGKPELAPPLPARLRFSMSRSGSLGLFALAFDSEVGVDLEDRSRVGDVEAVGGRIFSPAERAILDGLDDEEKQRSFCQIWTRKEAVLKALGVGLGAPLEALDVSGEVALWDTARPGVPDEPRTWFVHDLDVAPGYSAALATEAALPGGVPAVRDATELLPGAVPGFLGRSAASSMPAP